jgi:hypothetical protein
LFTVLADRHRRVALIVDDDEVLSPDPLSDAPASSRPSDLRALRSAIAPASRASMS